jgi:hypothetical protein
LKKIAVLLGLLGLLATGSAMAVSTGWSECRVADGAADSYACPSPTTMQPVPEPATLLLFGSGLIAIALIIRRRKNSPLSKGKKDRFIF